MKLAPVMPMPASRNDRAQLLARVRDEPAAGRPTSARRCGPRAPRRSARASGGSRARGCARGARRRAGRSTRRGRSRPGVSPAASSAWLSSISSETIDLPLAIDLHAAAPRDLEHRAHGVVGGGRADHAAAAARDRLLEALEQLRRARHGVAADRARAVDALAQSGWRSSTARAETRAGGGARPAASCVRRGVAERLVDAGAERLVAAVDDAHGDQPSRSSSSGSVVVGERDVVLGGHAAEVHEAADVARDELGGARLVHRGRPCRGPWRSRRRGT